MSPGATMERVYRELKERIISGHFAPGSRLEPAHLAHELAASATPVRDALQRLSGERLVESRHHEGFRQPALSESDLRDVYGWLGALMRLALRSPGPPPRLGSASAPPTPDDYPQRIADLFGAIALQSGNRELQFATFNAIDRSKVLRRAELAVDPASTDALQAMEADFEAGRWSDLRTKIGRFHRARIAAADRIAEHLRPPPPGLGQHS